MVEMVILQHWLTQLQNLSRYVAHLKERTKTSWKNKKAKSEEDKTLPTINCNYIVKVRHVGGEVIIQRDMTQIPRRQDLIKLGKDSYTVLGVVWNLADARTVTLIVRNV